MNTVAICAVNTVAAAVVAGQGHLTKDLGLEFGEHHMEVLWDRVKRCFPDIANQILSTRQPQHRRGETVILEEGGEK